MQYVLVGTTSGDGTGDPMRLGWQKTNSNMLEIYTAYGTGSGGTLVTPTDFVRSTWSAADAPAFRTAIGAGTGSGSVTSVALTAPSILVVGGSPITTAGTLTLALAAQTANSIFAGPASGASASPSFRAMVAADLPSDLTGKTFSGGTFSGPTISGGTGSGIALTGGSASGLAMTGGTASGLALTNPTISGLTLSGTTINSPTISGGTANGIVIGGTTSAAGTFTTVSATTVAATSNMSIAGQQQQAFRLILTNSGSNLQHIIMSMGSIGTDSTIYAGRVNGATNSYTNTATGTDGSTAFTAGVKISSANTNRLVFDTLGQSFSTAIITARVAYQTAGTALTALALLNSRDVNGTTRTRLELGIVNATTGANFALTTSNITSGNAVWIDFNGYLT